MYRKYWIDNLKGICLFFIVIGHLGKIPDELKYLLAPTDLLYVTIFFYLSGLLFRNEKYSYVEFFKNKFRNLLLPYFSITFIVSLLDWNLYLETATFIKSTLYHCLWGDGPIKGTPLWFVSTLLGANMILKTGLLISNKWLRILFFMFLPFLCYWFYGNDIRLPMRLDSAFGASFIMYMANSLHHISMNRWAHNLLLIISCVLFMVGLYFHVGLLNYNALHSWLSFPSAIGGCVLVSKISYKLLNKNCAILVWIAKNGLPILGFHCLIGFYLDVILKVFNTNELYIFSFKCLFVFAILYFITIPILSKIQPQLWGVKK